MKTSTACTPVRSQRDALLVSSVVLWSERYSAQIRFRSFGLPWAYWVVERKLVSEDLDFLEFSGLLPPITHHNTESEDHTCFISMSPAESAFLNPRLPNIKPWLFSRLDTSSGGDTGQPSVRFKCRPEIKIRWLSAKAERPSDHVIPSRDMTP